MLVRRLQVVINRFVSSPDADSGKMIVPGEASFQTRFRCDCRCLRCLIAIHLGSRGIQRNFPQGQRNGRRSDRCFRVFSGIRFVFLKET